MCGRFAIKFDVLDAEREFDVKEVLHQFQPNYNVAPMQNIPVVFNQDGSNVLDVFRWGLIPHWAKDEKLAYKMINSRIESVAEKPSFRRAFMEGRVLIPASGFYEWKKAGDTKQPYFIHLKEKDLFAFAGISSKWTNPKGEVIKTCSIITSSPNKFMEKIHDRMPVILSKKFEQKWISPEVHDKDYLLSMLAPYADKELDAYEVSTAVNSPRNNSPDILIPLKA